MAIHDALPCSLAERDRPDRADRPDELDLLEQRVSAARLEARATGQTTELALRGEQIMQLLGCGPGPQIGEALRYLTKCVAEDPACNTEAALGSRLEGWARPRPDRKPPRT